MSLTTKERIFQGVLDLARQGKNLYTVKVQDIATAAGLGKGTLYEYFASKEAILANTILWSLDRELAGLEDRLAGQRDFDGMLEAMQQYAVEVLTQRGSSYRMIVGALGGVPGRECPPQQVEAALESQKQRVMDLARRIIDTGRREGRIDPACTDDYCIYVLRTALVSSCAGGGLSSCQTLRQNAEHLRTMVRKALA